eukprot:TRINITY_DN5766_c0_g1_i2.p2 TRINITY_DN5766_c0_g1~~TRINITY_DN5766_c0_g1_i2.p2  ORF type:complete len:183 (-),score=41.99 TRINITY_DN5766_c0_g1_i2:17-565(-)
MFSVIFFVNVFFFFSSRRRHTRCREVSWARRCVQETDLVQFHFLFHQKVIMYFYYFLLKFLLNSLHEMKKYLMNFEYSVHLLYPQIFYQKYISHYPLLLEYEIHFAQPVLKVLLFLIQLFFLPMYSASVSYTHLTLPTILLVQISVVAVSLKKKKQKIYNMIRKRPKTRQRDTDTAATRNRC